MWHARVHGRGGACPRLRRARRHTHARTHELNVCGGGSRLEEDKLDEDAEAEDVDDLGGDHLPALVPLHRDRRDVKRAPRPVCPWR